jgi:hypothetical protein
MSTSGKQLLFWALEGEYVKPGVGAVLSKFAARHDELSNCARPDSRVLALSELKGGCSHRNTAN